MDAQALTFEIMKLLAEAYRLLKAQREALAELQREDEGVPR